MVRFPRSLVAVFAVALLSASWRVEMVTLSLNPTSGHAGQTISASGSGYQRRIQLEVRFDGSVVASVRVGNGKLSTSFVVPSLALAGDHSVTTTYAGDPTVLASATFSVIVSSPPPPPPPPPPPSGFVSRSGTDLMLDGLAWRPVGMNFPTGVEHPGVPYPARFADAMRDITGLDLARVWTVQADAIVAGVRDWTYIDQMLARAETYSRKVVMVLTDQWQSPNHQPVHDANVDRTPTWYSTGYKTTPDAYNTVTFKAWVTEIATRYKDRTSIAFWQIVNEGSAETASANPACANETTSRDILRAFADDIAATIKAADPNHLVSLGTVGGQCGSSEADYAYIHAGPNIDIADYHDYVGTATNIPGDPYNGLGISISRIHALGKVILVGESGIDWTLLTGGRTERATAFQNKITAQFGAGTSGLLMWTWGGYTQTNWGLEIPYGDPSLTVIANN